MLASILSVEKGGRELSRRCTLGPKHVVLVHVRASPQASGETASTMPGFRKAQIEDPSGHRRIGDLPEMPGVGGGL